MKLDTLIQIGNLPKGEIEIAIISNKIVERFKKIIQTIPHGVAKCRSLYTQYNIAILLKDALLYDIQYIQKNVVKNY
jgi:hypothetical protein